MNEEQQKSTDWERIRKEKQKQIRESQYFKKGNIEKTQQFGIIHSYLQIFLEKGLIKWEDRNKVFNEIAEWVLDKWVWFESEYLDNYFSKRAEIKKVKNNG